ncbi:MAG: site-specific integrase [Cohaesibacter sp.]|nr:site-specific integrase [Cohaesibacter sp.]
MRYIGPNTLVCEIDTKVIIKMEQQFRADDRAESTINRKRSSISKERGNQERILSMAEEKELLGYLKHIGLLLSYHLTNFLLYTGCRLGEAMSLQWSALKISDTRVTFIRTKNDKAWTIPLAKKARAAIEFAKREGFERPFVIPRDTYRDHFNRARHRLGFQDGKEFVIHMLRHTCLSRLVEKAVQLLIVKEWAGHNTNGTKDYPI